MSTFHIYRIIHRRTPRLIPVLVICLTLMAGCGKTEPTAIAIPPSATPTLSATKTLQQTQLSTGMQSNLVSTGGWIKPDDHSSMDATYSVKISLK